MAELQGKSLVLIVNNEETNESSGTYHKYKRWRLCILKRGNLRISILR